MASWRGPDPIDPVRQLQPYATPRPQGPIDLDLSGNEGSVPPQAVTDALCDLDAEALRTYPDLRALTAVIADRHGVSTDRVIVTAGGDQAIDLLARAFLEPGRSLLTHRPSFVMIERAARFAGADVTAIDWPAGPFPTEAFVDAASETTPLSILVTPNNPTGATIDAEVFADLADALDPALVVVDHAYVEFTDDDLTEVALERPNAAVIRTFSKAYGLAGARVGYLLGHPALINYLKRLRSPYPIASPAITAASARLGADDDVGGYVDTICDHRDDLETQLTVLGLDVLPSEANFVTAACPDPRWVFDGLAGLGIRTRIFPNRDGLESHVRITVPGDGDDLTRVGRAATSVVRPDALLFDMDGVIADVRESYREAIIQTAAAYGLEVTHDEIEARKHQGEANDDWALTHGLLTDAGIEVTFDEVKDTFEGRYLGTGDAPALFERERLIGGDAIDRLDDRLPLGIVTGRPRRDAVRFLEDADLDDRFDTVICKEDAAEKPDPEPVRLALERLGCSTGWLVGDTPDDIRAARRAGVVPLGIVPPGADATATRTALLEAGAARVLDDLADLPTLLDDSTTR